MASHRPKTALLTDLLQGMNPKWMPHKPSSRQIVRATAFVTGCFVHDMSLTFLEAGIEVFARCYCSQRRREKPHEVRVDIGDNKVTFCHCSCTAGTKASKHLHFDALLDIDGGSSYLLQGPHVVVDTICGPAYMGSMMSYQWTWHLCLAIFACTIGTSLQFGYNTGVVNAPQSVIEEFLNATNLARTGDPFSKEVISLLWSVIVSIWAVGGMIGGVSAGVLADKLGRRQALLYCNALILVGGLAMFFSKIATSYELLVLGRFLTGLHSGLGLGIGPLYLSEIAPLCLRGFIGTLNQAMIAVGLVLSQVLGLHSILGNESHWNYLLGIVIIPCIMQTLVLPHCPESPRYLFHCDRKAKALEALSWLHGGQGAVTEMRVIEQEEPSQVRKISMLDLFRQRSLRTALFISIVMQLSQQLSGINAVIYYSTRIFTDAGLNLDKAQYVTLGIGGVFFLMTLISAFLVDHAGRRVLHLGGLGGMWFFSILITIALSTEHMVPVMVYISIVGVVCYTISFSVGPGSIPWFIVSELFEQSARAAAVSMATLMNWLANFLVGLTFPAIEMWLGPYSFLPFTGFLMVFWIYIYLRLPETKNRPIDEIVADFQ